MRSSVVVLLAGSTIRELLQSLRTDHRQSQRLLPVVNADGQLAGVLTRGDIRDRIASTQCRMSMAEAGRKLQFPSVTDKTNRSPFDTWPQEETQLALSLNLTKHPLCTR